MRTLENAFRSECGEDFVGIWEILWKVYDLRPYLDADEARRATLEIVRQLLNGDQIIAGCPTRDGGFVRWRESPAEAVQRIEREWIALGTDPNIGDIVWFVRRDAARLIDAEAETT